MDAKKVIQPCRKCGGSVFPDAPPETTLQSSTEVYCINCGDRWWPGHVPEERAPGPNYRRRVPKPRAW